jgi:hypothetical protein
MLEGKMCVVCGRRYMLAGYDSDGAAEYIDITTLDTPGLRPLYGTDPIKRDNDRRMIHSCSFEPVGGERI